MRLLASLAAMAMLCPGSALAQNKLAPIENLIERGLREWDTPGLVIAVVKDDKVVLLKGYGVKELGRFEPPDVHTRVSIGSTSKAFGSAAIACLVDEGKVRWDDRVTQHLPWFDLSDPWVTHEARIRDILSHRVGPTLTTESSLYTIASSPEDLVRRMRFVKAAFPFRSTYGYSNGMFVAAGLVVESASGMSWDAYLREKVWRPLGMTETTGNVDEALRIGDRVTGHYKVDGKLQADSTWSLNRKIFHTTGPSGAVISTASDMSKWLRMQLGEGRFEGRQIISQEAFRQMHIPHSPIRGGPKQQAYWFTHLSAADLKSSHWSYALGWVVNDYRGRNLIWHGGTINHTRTVVALMPEEKLGVYIGVNALSLFPLAVALSTFDTFLNARDTDWFAVFSEQARRQETEQAAERKRVEEARIRGTRPSLPLDGYSGSYQDNGAFGPIQVRLKDGRLTIRMGEDEGGLEHWHQDVFRVHWLPVGSGDPSFATFTIGPDGTTQQLDLEDIGVFEREKSVEDVGE